jgi:copper(I)-binding protein
MSKIFSFGLAMIVLGTGCQRASDKAAIRIEEVWSRPVMVAEVNRSGAMADSATANGHHAGSNGVVYLVIQNHGGAADRLLRARAEVCETTELHETIMDGDRMMMQPAENGIEIPAQSSAKLEPRGRHIMLMGLKRSLAVGDSIELHLDFEKSGTKTVFSVVRQP